MLFLFMGTYRPTQDKKVNAVRSIFPVVSNFADASAKSVQDQLRLYVHYVKIASDWQGPGGAAKIWLMVCREGKILAAGKIRQEPSCPGCS
jgi:hypothetical protein